MERYFSAAANSDLYDQKWAGMDAWKTHGTLLVTSSVHVLVRYGRGEGATVVDGAQHHACPVPAKPSACKALTTRHVHFKHPMTVSCQLKRSHVVVPTAHDLLSHVESITRPLS